ncbi:MAG TPA: terminase gpA endonuclease subunit [bacterium]|nr:terminase gpA endonuclease subunit [bacterium]
MALLRKSLSPDKRALATALLKSRVRENLALWAVAHIGLERGPFRFDGHEYLRAIYGCTNRRIVVEKSAQCGISTWLIARSFWLAKEFALRVLYVFPAKAQLSTFVADRVDRALDDSPAIKAALRHQDGELLAKRRDQVGLKHLGRGAIVFVGSKTVLDVLAMPIDDVIIDELDFCVGEHLGKVERRLGHSDFKGMQKVSTPTLDEMGINAEYLASDRRVWTVACAKCGEEQELRFFGGVYDLDGRDVRDARACELLASPDVTGWQSLADALGRDVHVYCRKCGKPMNRLTPGYWLAQQPGRETAGFKISKLMSATNAVAELVWTYHRGRGNQTALQDFYNFDLGEPYTPKGARIDPAMLDRCRLEGYLMPSVSDAACTAGVDVGAKLHVRISELTGDAAAGATVRKAVYIGELDTFDEVAALMARYSIRAMVVDHLPETRATEDFAARFPGRVFLAEYDTHPRGAGWLKEGPDWPGSRIIKLDRTASLDESGQDILERRDLLPENARAIPEYYDHMSAPVRVLEDAADGNKRAVYREGGKPDHYRHAVNYDRAAMEIIKTFVLPLDEPAVAARVIG